MTVHRNTTDTHIQSYSLELQL